MSPEQLYSLISTDTTALAQAIAGEDIACAARCSEISTPILSPTPILMGKVLISQVCAAAGIPFGGGQFTTSLKTLVAENAAYSSTVADLLEGLEPWAPGLDFANQIFRDQLDSFVAAAKLDSQIVTALKNAAMIKPVITANDVSTACRPYRSYGRVGQQNWTGVIS